MWESCPICEETPEDRKLKERAEQAERERNELREALHSLLWEADYYARKDKDLKYQCEKARRALGGE
jgi:uncharacterized Zn finger protein (UPF0148 family)